MSAAKMRQWAERAGPHAEFAEIEGGHLEAPDRARGVIANWLDRIADCGLRIAD